MGLLGGTLFTGAFYLAFWAPYRTVPPEDHPSSSDLKRVRPFLLGITAGSIVGMLSSTRSYRIDTYMLLALATVYLRLVADHFPLVNLRLDTRLIQRLAVLGVLVLVILYCYVRVASG
jgi:hypothetical protein